MATEYKRQQRRQGTAAQWASANPILLAGEDGYESDTGKIKVGDGVTAWNSLSYFGNVPANIVLTTGAQTLTGKTLGNLKEGVYTISDGPSVDLDPANGPLQAWTLTTNRTPTATNFVNGQSMKLRISGNYTITWPSVVWMGTTPGSSGTAPAAPTTGFLHVELWKESNVLYGAAPGWTAT